MRVRTDFEPARPPALPLTPKSAVAKVQIVPTTPTRLPRFGELFDLRAVGSLCVMVALVVVSCDLVNRGVNRKLLPKEQAPDPTTWTEGKTASVRLALKTQDAERNSCASGRTVGELRCDFDANKKRVSRRPDEPLDDNLRTSLQPYKTAVGDQALAIGGVWHTPELAFRRHREPSRERRGAQLQTFYAECEVEFVGQFDSVEVRYDLGKPWSTAKNLPIARAQRCTILEAEELAVAGEPETR